ncbi:MAG TPA: hypothetical protein VF017_24225 [Thermoanaerobaculia bacterium]|nr:hypothetical protein [Thermoanaerobaculia bacterium]
MFCPQCGSEYRPGFTECADCGVPLVEAAPDAESVEKFQARAGDGTIVSEEATVLGGKALSCQHCGGTSFSSRTIQLNTRGLTFLSLEWMNRAATVFVCVRCGHLHWFLAPEVEVQRAAVAPEMEEEELGDEEETPSQCMSCGAEMPVGAVRCSRCGWSYQAE